MYVRSKIEFDNAAATLAARMLSLDSETREAAAQEASQLLAWLPRDLKNSAQIKDQALALQKLIDRVWQRSAAYICSPIT